MGVDDYLKLPYHIEIVWNNSRDFTDMFARVIEFPGCTIQAFMWEDMGEKMEDTMRGWIAICLENGQPVPLPRED
jgi:predicted RNase H-like HicB family nuclease